jgi:hypothetical protein
MTQALAEPGSRSAAEDPSVLDRLRQARNTTPGQLSLIVVGLVVLSLLAGLVAASALAARRSTLNDLALHREPVAAAAQEIYRALSDADATAAAGFLSGGVEPEKMRSRYQVDIAQAGSALAVASVDVGNDPKAKENLTKLAMQLPVYTGLIETARTYNRQGFPAGAAYLREASGLMRQQILPAAQDLYRIDIERMAAEQDEATSIPWLPALVMLALLAALVATQRYLARRTNRVFNVGLVIATGAVLVAVLWSGIAIFISSVQVAGGRDNGSEPVAALVKIRIAALQARADETLTLVARGGGSAYEQEFTKLFKDFGGEDGGGGWLAEAKQHSGGLDISKELDAATKAAKDWRAAHTKLHKQDENGEYNEAVATAIGDDPASAAIKSRELDANLLAAINNGRDQFVKKTTTAANTLLGLEIGLVVLGMLAAAGATLGIWQRLREYR